MNPCPFCTSDASVLRNDLAYARFDQHPVNPGHLLILPLRHVGTWFEASREEKEALLALVAYSGEDDRCFRLKVTDDSGAT